MRARWAWLWGRAASALPRRPELRDGNVHLRSGESLTLALAGTATRCPNTTLTRTFNDGGTASITVDDAGLWSSSTTVADGVSTTVTISPVDGGSTSLVVDALTTSPRVVVASPTRDDWDVWHLVASKVDAGCGSGGNINAERFARAGYVSDIDCADGGQFNPSVTVTGASGGWLSVTWNGVSLVDAGISSSPATLTSAQLGTLTLPELAVGEARLHRHDGWRRLDIAHHLLDGAHPFAAGAARGRWWSARPLDHQRPLCLGSSRLRAAARTGGDWRREHRVRLDDWERALRRRRRLGERHLLLARRR